MNDILTTNADSTDSLRSVQKGLSVIYYGACVLVTAIFAVIVEANASTLGIDSLKWLLSWLPFSIVTISLTAVLIGLYYCTKSPVGASFAWGAFTPLAFAISITIVSAVLFRFIEPNTQPWVLYAVRLTGLTSSVLQFIGLASFAVFGQRVSNLLHLTRTTTKFGLVKIFALTAMAFLLIEALAKIMLLHGPTAKLGDVRAFLFILLGIVIVLLFICSLVCLRAITEAIEAIKAHRNVQLS